MSTRRDSRTETAAPANPAMATITSAECKAAIASLEGQLEALRERRTTIASDREKIAAAALVDGDSAAKQRLKALGAEAAAIEVEVQDVEAATKAAKERLRLALQAEAERKETASGHAALAILAQRRDAAADATNALSAFAEAMERLFMSGRELRKISPRATSDRHLKIVMEAATQMTACDLFKRGIAPMSALPPEQFRVGLAAMVGHLDAPVQAWAETLTAKGTKKAEAA